MNKEGGGKKLDASSEALIANFRGGSVDYTKAIIAAHLAVRLADHFCMSGCLKIVWLSSDRFRQPDNLPETLEIHGFAPSLHNEFAFIGAIANY